MKIFDKFKRVADPRARAVAADMERLEALESGLGKKALDFIISGKNETVLSTLSAKCTGSELEVFSRYIRDKSPIGSRRKVLAQANPFDIEFAKRYTEVLSAATTDLSEYAAGTDKAHRLVRVFFSEAFLGVRKKTNVWPAKPIEIGDKGLSITTAMELTKVLGGTEVDLIDVLFQEQHKYGSITGDIYRQAINIKPLFEQHPQAVIEASQRIHAQARVKLIQSLHQYELANTEDYRDFILQLAGNSAKAVREAAGSILSAFDPKTLEPKAIELLGKGNVTVRAGMVELLSKFDSESALDALRTHKEKEKTARIVSAIETAITVSASSQEIDAATDDRTQYQAIDGTVVEIPPMQAIPETQAPTFGDEDHANLIQIIKEENERIAKRNEESKQKGYSYRAKPLKERLAKDAINFFNADKPSKKELRSHLFNFLSWGAGRKWTGMAMSKMPVEKALRMVAAVSNLTQNTLASYAQGPFVDCVREYLYAENGDVRNLEAIEIELKREIWFGYGSDRVTREMMPGDLIRYAIRDDYSYLEPEFDNIPLRSLWPYLAENLTVIDEAFGIKPPQGIKLSRVGAIRVLHRLPKTPARYFGPLLDAATGETKSGRTEARKMLSDAPKVAQHIFKLVNDSRQAIRAGAAEWLSELNETEAIPVLKARLKKEKSEIAKAAILTSLEALGEDLSGYVSPKILLEEAEKGLKKAKFTKLEWLNLDHLPKVHYQSKRQVPAEVLKWWIFLAVKLKQPGGNALFDIYLERLNPEDAATFSTWVLDSWYNYDTSRPSEQDGNEHAKQNAAQRYKYLKKWYKEYTEEQAFEDLKREYMSNYMNSGAATKGLLALGKHTPPGIAADRVRAYLKQHGSRTSQASSLLELLAGIGDPVALQVVISAATRLKQKGVQKFAGSLVEKVAEAKSWSLDELGDRTIPSAGLDEDGALQLPCGIDEKMYVATMSDALTLEIRNPDGKVIKSLPAGKDDSTKASKKQLSASRRELKQVVTMQSARLYEALCSERKWPVDDWKTDISEHPIMRKMIERVVWLGLDDNDNIVNAFRPTAEGDYTDAEDQDVDLDQFKTIRLAHGALMKSELAKAWQSHLKDYEVKPLFIQFGRTLLSINKGQQASTEIEDRKGWVTDTFTIRGAASKLGYDRGETLDGGYFCEYIKTFQGAELVAVIEFSGNCLPEENVPAATISLSFKRYVGGRQGSGSVKLSEVPPVLLSECWNDYQSFAAKAAFDKNWEQKMPWM